MAYTVGISPNDRGIIIIIIIIVINGSTALCTSDLLANGYRWGVKEQGCEADRSPPNSAEPR
jgi:hypothetical protein